MKKLLLDMYLKKNLGDDLFFKIISERYPNTIFYIQPGLNYNKKNYPKNIKIIRNLFTRTINVIEKKLKLNTLFVTNFLKLKCDAYIVLGGSMFIEKKKFDKKIIYNKYFKIKKPFYILGSNFGPYKSNNYYEAYKNIFEKTIDISFRDKYSYELFKNLKNVRVNPDIVFSLDTSNIELNEEEKVIISVINCRNRFEEKVSNKYENLIIDLINKFDKFGYKVILMSFCKYEGDEEAINEILSEISSDELKNKIEQYNYNGNIEEALNVLGKAKIIVGSRFHANILGLVMNKTILPIAYSDKTINVLKDINFKGKIIDIRKIDEFNINELTKKDLEYKINVEKYKKNAQKHFEKLDEFLKD